MNDTLLEKSPLKEAIIKGVDISIYRELTGGIYFGEKHLSEDGTLASDLCAYHKEEIERIRNHTDLSSSQILFYAFRDLGLKIA